jgi:hypothetical protein
MPGPSPPLAKTTWTDADFDMMGWHDAAVHALAFKPAPPWPGRLLIDLDYIVEWTRSDATTEFSFWLCPATLVFDQARDLVIGMNLSGFAFEPSLDSITRSDADTHGGRDWQLDGHGVTVSVHATGFTQYLRHAPIHSSRQRLTVDQRGGVTFAERSYT